MRKPLRALLLAAVIPSSFFVACDDGSTAPQETLARFDLDLPAAVTEGDTFDLAITAVGSEGSRPFTEFSGDVTLVATDGSGSAATIEPASVTVTEGTGAADAVILGASGEVSVEAGGGGATGSGEITVAVDTTRRLAGDPSDPAAEAIPDRTFEPDPDDYSNDHPDLGGIDISFNTLVLAFELGTTVGEANEVLTAMEAEIVGGIPGAAGVVAGILVVRVPTSSHEEMDALIEELRANEHVAHVVQDGLLETQEIPRENEDAGWNNWLWGSLSTGPNGGNWGLELIGVPAMWNLNDNVGNTAVTGILDAGFSASHEDLDYLEYQYPRRQHDHGTHVAGTIGATFDNGIGVDGLNPFADLVVRGFASWTSGIAQMIYAQPDVRVINVSMQYAWGNTDPTTNEGSQAWVREQGSLFRILLAAIARNYDLPLVVVAAGNYALPARWGSMATYAGLVLDPPIPGSPSPIIVVEALEKDSGARGGATLASYSNTGGDISAPGTGIMSTVEGGYAYSDGTSMAAPHVTGLISYLYALAPNLTHEQVWDVLEHNSVPVDGGASNRIDAYRTALDIDRVRGNTDIRRKLFDIDSNGLFDANDIAAYVDEYAIELTDWVESCNSPFYEPCPIYTRFDLNGDGLSYGSRYDYDVGGPAPFDLDIDGSYGTVTFDMVDLELTYEEYQLTDLQILCYNAYSSAYQGNATARDAELYELCGDTGVVPTVACRDLAPESSSGIPLDRIDLGAAPEEFEPPLLAKVEAEGSPTSYTFVQLDDDGSPKLVSPIHPSLSPQGGPVEVTLTDGTLACEPFAFEVDPLPPAPGELAAIAGLFQDVLGAQAEVLGTTPAEIVATPVDDLPPALYPLALAQSVLDHPQNPNSLAAFAHGTSPDADAARLDLMEPLVARTGLRSELAGIAARVAQSSPGSGTPSAGAPPILADIDSDLCTPGGIGNDAGRLNACMNMAWSDAFRTEGASARVIEDIGAALGAAGMIPGADLPAAIPAIIAWLVSNERAKNAALLPSVLTSFDFDHDPSEFLEDEDGPGRWENARLTAQNLTWDGGKEVLEGLLNIVGLFGAFDKVQITKTELSTLENYILSGPVASKLLEEGTPFTSIPQTFGPVDATADQWSESRVATGDAIVRTSHQEYEPREAGTATLSVRTEDGSFGGQQLSAQKVITVKELQVLISPDERHVGAGNTVQFTVTVVDADHPEDLEIDPEPITPLQGTAQISYNGGDTHTVTYTAPPKAQLDVNKPDLLTVQHKGETGALEHSGDIRGATATIRFGKITISPRGICLNLEEEQTFEAEVEGLEDETVIWSADVGEIDPETGDYTAPEEAPEGGTATITATSAVNADIFDEVTIDIGECDLCTVNLDLSGGITGSTDGPTEFREAGPLLQIEWDGTYNGATGGPITGAVATDQWGGEPGTFAIVDATAVHQTASPGSAQYDEDSSLTNCAGCGGSITVDEVTDEVITGSFQVSMYTYPENVGDDPPPLTTAAGTFRAAKDIILSDDDPYTACLELWNEK